MYQFQKNRGVVLIMVLWIIFLLSLMVFTMSRRSAIEVTSIEHYQGKLRSYAAARGGVNFVLNALNASASTTDTLFATGIALKQGQTPENLFSHIDVGNNAYAIVEWEAEDFVSPGKKHAHGLEDEGGKININAIHTGNYRILGNLFELKGLKRNEANAVALHIATHTISGDGTPGLEDLQLKPKHKPFEYLEEILHVSGVTQDLFKKIKKDLTVYGDAPSGLFVNVNTANNDVITALVNAAAEVDPLAQGASLINQAYALRDGLDGKSFTADDGKGEISGNLAGWPPALIQGKSFFVRAHVIGVDRKSGARTKIEATIDLRGTPTQNAIVGWHRD